jgi:hypothetical protein
VQPEARAGDEVAGVGVGVPEVEHDAC